jgi:Golgi-resident PAP phosphatase
LTLISDKADVYLHSGKISKWDICAPNAILESYGGKLTKLNGQEIDYSYKNTEPYLIDTGIVASVKDHKYFVKLFGN